MLILFYAPKPATTAGGVNWDEWTAISTLILAAGTIVLAGVTLWTLLYTIRATNRDRQQAAEDRIAADKRLTEEREAGDRRLDVERAHDANMRRRDRQIANIAVLVARVAYIRTHMDGVPGAYQRAAFSSLGASIGARRLDEPETMAAISELKHGAWAEAAMLGTSEAAELAAGRCRRLA